MARCVQQIKKFSAYETFLLLKDQATLKVIEFWAVFKAFINVLSMFGYSESGMLI